MLLLFSVFTVLETQYCLLGKGEVVMSLILFVMHSMSFCQLVSQVCPSSCMIFPMDSKLQFDCFLLKYIIAFIDKIFYVRLLTLSPL